LFGQKVLINLPENLHNIGRENPKNFQERMKKNVSIEL
jgi:hypothetical protein